MKSSDKFKIIYNNFVQPIYDLAEKYTYSALTVDERLNDEKITKQFEKLKSMLSKQLDKLRKESKKEK